MKKHTLSVVYEIGQKIKTDGAIYKVIGFEFIKSRGTRYILLSLRHGNPEWIYLYDFEIKMMD